MLVSTNIFLKPCKSSYITQIYINSKYAQFKYSDNILSGVLKYECKYGV